MKNVSLFRCVYVAFFSAAMVTAASAQIVECTGKDGRKEYAQTCPPGTAKQREIAKSTPTKSDASSDSVEPKKSSNDLELEFQQRRIAREQEADKAERREQAAKSNCAELMRRIDMYETSGRIFRTDPATGKKIYMEDDQRAAMLVKLRSDAKQCR